jgi:hypothetical protein
MEMMRTSWPIVMLFCGACGDNLLVGEEQGPPEINGEFEAEVSFSPDVCSARSWSTVPFADHDVDLSVTPTATGAAIFAVERAGGPLRGFTIDGRGDIDTKVEGTTIRDDQPFTAVSAAFIDERLVTVAQGMQRNIEIDMIRPDLGAHVTLASAPGLFAGDAAVSRTRGDRFVAIGDTASLTGLRFDTAWQLSASQSLDATSVKSMSSARYFDDTIVAWSSGDTCTLDRVAAGRISERDFQCLNPRLAVNEQTRRGYMVFEDSSDNVMLSEIRINGESELANVRLLAPHARGPKIVFDGVRFWVSYLDQRNDVVVGYIDDKGTLISMALEGTQPLRSAYELAVTAGSVWVFSVDDAGIGAQRMCLKPVR